MLTSLLKQHFGYALDCHSNSWLESKTCGPPESRVATPDVLTSTASGVPAQQHQDHKLRNPWELQKVSSACGTADLILMPVSNLAL